MRVATELRFRLAFEGNLAPMTVTNPDDQISAANAAFCDMVGFSKGELIGHDSKVFTFPDDIGITEESHRRAISGETEQSRYIKRYLRKDGKVIFVEVLRSQRATKRANFSISSSPSVTSPRRRRCPLKSHISRSTIPSRDSPIGRSLWTGSPKVWRGPCVKVGRRGSSARPR